MHNIWILTEERPKPLVIYEILNQYMYDFNDTCPIYGTLKVENSKFHYMDTQHTQPQPYIEVSELKIKPIIENGVFQFKYIIEGFKLLSIENIFIKIVSGYSSFVDFLVFKQQNEPANGEMKNLIMAIEETKTSDDESRNTGVYQRASKFIFIKKYLLSNTKLYMLYSNETDNNKNPSDTNILGTRMLLTLGVKILGKNYTYKPFTSIYELIDSKSRMRKPPKNNVPIEILKFDDKIEISGRLAKPKEKGNIGHDPNIGALSLISACLRELGWKKSIVITKHGVLQNYIDKEGRSNKFLFICKILEVNFDNITILYDGIQLPNKYWHYEEKSEKVASIFLHIIAEYYGLKEIYQNHAGCERGYFITANNSFISIPKKDENKINICLPDLILYDQKTNTIINIEGKQISTLKAGIREIENYDRIEKNYVHQYYPNCKIYRYICIFGGEKRNYLHDSVLLYLNKNGEIFINPNSPECIKTIFKNKYI